MNDLPQPPLELYKSDTVSCTLVNKTSGALQYNKSSKTGGDLSIEQPTLESGESAVVFKANGSGGISGCGGQVIYNLPNGEDQLVLVYNVDDSSSSAQIFAELQNQSKTRAGCDSYFVVVLGAAAENYTSLSPKLTVYEAGVKARTVVGYVPESTDVRITICNQLDTWITLNHFPNPEWNQAPVCTNATTSIAPGTSGLVLIGKSKQQMTQIFNIDADTLLTIQQQKSDYPTAGLNISSPYKVGVTKDDENYDFYTVTVSPA
jgi:hypothetical protein